MKLVASILLLVVSGACGIRLPSTCDKPVYCKSKLLHHIQLARIFPDSKTFVDFQLIHDQHVTLTAFEDLLSRTDDAPSKNQLQQFIGEYFNTTDELDKWTPSDHKPNPPFLENIQDEQFKIFATNVHNFWPTLGRKVKSVVLSHPERYSFIPVSNGFIIPGGRFKELYYWDTYWIIKGLLLSKMPVTVKGVLQNFFELVRKIGHVPNGSRWYYQERSQPPLLTAMVDLYLKETNDNQFLKDNIDVLEKELQYWMRTQVKTFHVGTRSYKLLHYNTPSEGPRPESYYEDYTNAQTFDRPERRQQFYNELKSAAASGWDFSSRWFIDQNGNSNDDFLSLRCSEIIPVELNAIFANALKTVANYQMKLQNTKKHEYWAYHAKQWEYSIQSVLWNEEDGIWYDWNLANGKHRKYFYPSNLSPLWMQVVDKDFISKNAPRILDWLVKSNVLSFPGGLPTTLSRSGQQWDFPNSWPPLVSIVVSALEVLDTDEALDKSRDIVQTYLRASLKGFLETNQLFEKYDVESPGKVGGGGEYEVQVGFGWTNGIVLEFLNRYGSVATSQDDVVAPTRTNPTPEPTNPTPTPTNSSLAPTNQSPTPTNPKP